MNSNAQKILFWCFILLLFTAISFAAPPVEVTDYNNYYRDIEDENKSLRKTNEFFAHKNISDKGTTYTSQSSIFDFNTGID